MTLNTRIKNAHIRASTFACMRDGLTIRGTEYRPQGERLPVAVVCHGFMAFQDTVRRYAVKLAEAGYLSYCFDFCGGSVIKGKSDGKTTEMSVYTEVDDLLSVIDHAKSREYADERKILLMGCSQGGLVAALAAARLEDAISKLVLFYPAFCIPHDARAGKMMFAKFDPHNVPDAFRCGLMKLGKRYVTDVSGIDPYVEIQAYRGDVLIVHGTKDGIVSLDYSEKAADAYSRRKDCDDRTVVFKTVKNGKHMFGGKHDKTAIEYLERFISTCDR